MSVFTPQEKKKKKSRKRLWITLIAAVVIIAITVASVASKRRDKPIPVTTEKAMVVPSRLSGRSMKGGCFKARPTAAATI